MAGQFAAVANVYNVTLTSADTEYSQALPNGCTHYEFQARTSVAIRFAFETGKVATPTAPYATLKAGQAYESFNKWPSSSITLFFASASAGTVVELIAWT